MDFLTLIGLDFSREAVSLCNKWYEQENLDFREGNAQDLPFQKNSFDVVYNVESSHCYGDMSTMEKMKEEKSEMYRKLKNKYDSTL